MRYKVSNAEEKKKKITALLDIWRQEIQNSVVIKNDLNYYYVDEAYNSPEKIAKKIFNILYE